MPFQRLLPTRNPRKKAALHLQSAGGYQGFNLDVMSTWHLSKAVVLSVKLKADLTVVVWAIQAALAPQGGFTRTSQTGFERQTQRRI